MADVQDEDEVEDEEANEQHDADAEQLLMPVKQCAFLLPPYPTPTAAPDTLASEHAADAHGYDMKYSHELKGVPGLEQLLHTFYRCELEAVVEVLGFDTDEFLTKLGRQKDKRTGIFIPCTVGGKGRGRGMPPPHQHCPPPLSLSQESTQMT